jgi:glucose dehydrogenase
MLVLAVICCVAVKGAEWRDSRDSDDWPMYGRNLHHSFDNPDSLLTPNNVAALQKAWVFLTGDAGAREAAW